MDDIFGVKSIVNSLAVEVKDLSRNENNMDIEYIKSISRKIDMDAKPVFDYFFGINNIPVERYPQYYCSPIWNAAYNNYKWRYIIIAHNDCKYLVMLRIVGVMYHEQYVALSYDVLSDTPTKADINSIIGFLRKIQCIKKVETITNGDDWDAVNFYNTELPKVKNYKKKKVEILKTIGVYVAVINCVPSNEMLHNIDGLYNWFEMIRFKFNRKRQDKYMYLLRSLNTPFFVSYYKGRVIGVKFASNDFGNSIYCHASKNISPFSVEKISEYTKERDLNKCLLIKKYLGVFEEQEMNRYFLESGYDAVFNDGIITKSENGLFEHKKEHYKNMIKYKLIDINDYEY